MCLDDPSVLLDEGTCFSQKRIKAADEVITPSFNNIAVLPEMLTGCVVADMVAILGSMFFVVGDIDK